MAAEAAVGTDIVVVGQIGPLAEEGGDSVDLQHGEYSDAGQQRQETDKGQQAQARAVRRRRDEVEIGTGAERDGEVEPGAAREAEQHGEAQNETGG